MGEPVVDILMYHSISNRGGPTAIPQAVFAEQMEALAWAEVPVITLDDYLAAREGQTTLAPHSVIITFDDGFQDFADVAWPIMTKHRFRPMIYLPTAYVGRAEGWRGVADPPRALMGWATIRSLAREGVEFGSHTLNHPELDALSEAALEAELVGSRAEIEERIDRAVRHFAPPYGMAGPRVRAKIAETYHSSAGTRLARARLSDDPFDLPRIEMHYFADINRWRAHLAGRGGAYLALRQALRRTRGLLVKPWRGV